MVAAGNFGLLVLQFVDQARSAFGFLATPFKTTAIPPSFDLDQRQY